MGTANIVSGTIHYSIDNGPASSIAWTGNLAPLDIDSFILVGTANITSGSHTIKAWSAYPNNTIDFNPSNDSKEKIINAQPRPIISVTPTSLSGTATHCNDTLNIPLNIKNNGTSTLNYSLNSDNTSPLKVLLLTFGSEYYNTAYVSLGYSFNNYEVTTSITTDSTELQNEIIGKDIIVVPYINSNSSASTYGYFASTLQTFVSNGGIIMFTGQHHDDVILNTGFWPNFQSTSRSNSGTDISSTNHSITSTITPSDLNYQAASYFYVTSTPSNFTTLLNEISPRKVAGFFPYGDGTVFYLGLKYDHPSVVMQSKLISESLRWIYENRTNCLGNSTISGSINAGDSTIINVELNSTGLQSGSYINDLSIISNDYNNLTIVVPCTLNVQNQIDGSFLGNDTISCTSLTLDAGSGFSSYLWSNGSNSQSINVTLSGTYSVTVNSGEYCSASDTIDVVIVTNTTATITGLPPIICTGDDDIILTGFPAGGTFIGPSITGNMFSPSNAGEGSFIIMYNYNGTSCSSTASETIIIHSSPIVSLNGLDTSYCPYGAAQNLIGLPIGGVFTGTGILGNIFSPTVAGLGIHDIIYSFTSNDGCINSDTVSTNVSYADINVDIIIPDTGFCIDDASQVQLSATPGGGAFSGNGVIATSFYPNVAGLGSHYITYTKPYSTMCDAVDSIKVIVGLVPTAFAGNDISLPCNINGIPLGQSPINGVSYSWTPNVGLSDASIANPILNITAAINYTLTATDITSGCSNTDIINISIANAPITTTTNDTLICAYSPITISATGGSDYVWSNGDVGSSITVTPLESTLYYVIVTEAGCSTVDTVIVNVSNPKPSLGDDTTLCESQSITLDAGIGNISYDWNNGSTNQAITIDTTGIGIGSITIDVEVADNMGCIGKDTIMITFVDCTGLNNIDLENFIISVYPNPTKGKFTISSTETNIAKLKLEVLDVNGRIVYKNQVLNTKGFISENIDLSHRAKGIYIMRLSNGSLIKTFKVVVQ